MAKALYIDYQKCTGCRLCELVCAVSHDGISNPARSRIRVIKWEAEGLYIPMSCQQCQEAPCMNVCPVKAISRDEEMGRVYVDYDVCIGCRSCVGVCPFGAMSFNTIDKRSSSATSVMAILSVSDSVKKRPSILLRPMRCVF